MGVRLVTPQSEVSMYLIQSLRIIHEEVKRALLYLGEQSVVKVRDRSGEESWFDQTGNLRSSVGYALYERGRKEFESSFSIIKQGAEGSEEGRRMVEELAHEYSNTYALVVVAAMNYAEYVEAMENKDVLASAELFARGKVNEYLNKALQRAERRISKL